jgi:hypothetical protein
MPPMKRKKVLETISLLDKVLTKNSKSLFVFLEKINYDDLMSFDQFLMGMELTEDEYIQIILNVQ